jgi:hypothetical protein
MTGKFATWLENLIVWRTAPEHRHAVREEWSHGARTIGRLFVANHQHELELWDCGICRMTYHGRPLRYMRSGIPICTTCYGEPSLRPANGGAL